MDLLEQLSSVSGILQQEWRHAEKITQLTTKQLELIHQYKWFNLFVPRAFNGLELTLPEGLRIEEALAQLDGSLSWTVTLCSGANLFVGYLDFGLAKRLFRDPKVCLAGSGKASGQAHLNEKGYTISGQWSYATGAPHATAFTANCQLMADGKPLLNERGEQVIKSFVFFDNEVQLLNDWQTMGLKATASCSFKASNVLVDESRCFEIHPSGAKLPHAIYRYPFQQLAETTLAVNTLGMALRFLQCCEELFLTKYIQTDRYMVNKVNLRSSIIEAKEAVKNWKHTFYDLVTESWEQLETQGQIDEMLLNRLSDCSLEMVRGIRQWIAFLYPYCGMYATHPEAEINYIFRNLFTASQHNLLV
ncbi:hypothetical protein GCM10023231_15060 [Olivibacter ginsenosidimutans]|uniref:Acyl-CoA dehydrogenase n=1 Tax=Olivibacter ginsenosidimutans TaxID=1176537 RepID=A0ABP9AZK9_9SPHI